MKEDNGIHKSDRTNGRQSIRNASSVFFDIYDAKSLCDSLVEGGRKGISVQSAFSSEEEVQVKAIYTLKLSVPFFRPIRFQKDTAVKRRVFSGSGKTTLLKAIASEYEINSGYEEVDIISSGDFNIGYVKQNDGYSLDMKMIDYIRSSFKDILDIERKLNTLEDEMSTHYDEKIVSKYNDLLSRYEYMGGYKYKKEIEVILNKFDFAV